MCKLDKNTELEVQLGVGAVALPVVDSARMLLRKAGAPREFLWNWSQFASKLSSIPVDWSTDCAHKCWESDDYGIRENGCSYVKRKLCHKSASPKAELFRWSNLHLPFWPGMWTLMTKNTQIDVNVMVFVAQTRGASWFWQKTQKLSETCFALLRWI